MLITLLFVIRVNQKPENYSMIEKGIKDIQLKKWNNAGVMDGMFVFPPNSYVEI